jgi:hypothetical protein
MSGSTKHISLQGRDQAGAPYTVQLAVAEQNETGTLRLLTPGGEVVQQFELTHLKKGKEGTRLTCHVSGATATLSLEHDKDPPALHVTASLIVPILDAVYPLDRAEHRRMIEWIKGLSIGSLD